MRERRVKDSKLQRLRVPTQVPLSLQAPSPMLTHHQPGVSCLPVPKGGTGDKQCGSHFSPMSLSGPHSHLP